MLNFNDVKGELILLWLVYGHFKSFTVYRHDKTLYIKIDFEDDFFRIYECENRKELKLFLDFMLVNI